MQVTTSGCGGGPCVRHVAGPPSDITEGYFPRRSASAQRILENVEQDKEVKGEVSLFFWDGQH